VGAAHSGADQAAVLAQQELHLHALGLALEEGRVGLDDPVVSYFPEVDAEITDPRSRSVTLGHLASAGQHRVQAASSHWSS